MILEYTVGLFDQYSELVLYSKTCGAMVSLWLCKCSHSDLNNTISVLHLWKILLVKSQKSEQCGCKCVRNGCTGPCNK